MELEILTTYFPGFLNLIEIRFNPLITSSTSLFSAARSIKFPLRKKYNLSEVSGEAEYEFVVKSYFQNPKFPEGI